MSTSSTSGSTDPFSTTSATLATSQLANGAAFNVTGLASGIDTNALISAMMAVQEQPEQELQVQEAQVQAQQTQLQSIQTSLQSLSDAAASLADPSLFQTSQSVTTSDPNLISAVTTGGAGVGGYEVNVTALANSAQRTFTFTSPSSTDNITIDGKAISIAAGSTAQDVADTINSDGNATVWAAVTNANTLVLSDRQTGDTGSGFIDVSDPGSALTEQTSLAKEGQNAEFTVGDTSYSETSNTITDAIPGVTMTLNSLTPTAPVTVTVQPPAANQQTVSSAVQSFVQQYNTTIQQIETQLSTAPSNTTSPPSGTLYEDEGLQGLLDDMRQMMYTAVGGQPSDASSLTDIGISTGAASGDATTSQATLSGQLQLNTSQLTQELQADPDGVQTLLESWGTSFQSRVDVDAAPGGTLDSRIQGDSSQISDLQGQVTTMNEMLQVRQAALEAQYAQLESALSQTQAQGQWLSGQITAMQANSTG